MSRAEAAAWRERIAAIWRRDRMWWSVTSVWLVLLGGVAWVGGDGLFMYRFMVVSFRCGPRSRSVSPGTSCDF
jgi:hypothetical protein